MDLELAELELKVVAQFESWCMSLSTLDLALECDLKDEEISNARLRRVVQLCQASAKAGRTMDWASFPLDTAKQRAFSSFIVSLVDEVLPSDTAAFPQRLADLRALRSRGAWVGRLRDASAAVEAGGDLESILGALWAAHAHSSETGRVYSMREVLGEAYELIQKCQEGTGQVPTGIPELDNGGCLPMPGDYIICGARPSIGKTALGLHIARAMAMRGDACLVVSLEMTRALLGLRHISTHAGIPGEEMLAKKGMNDGQFDRVGSAVQALRDIPLWTYVNRDLADMLATARRLHRAHACKAVFIDYLGIIQCPDEDRRDLELARASAEFQDLAHETGMVVYGFSQLNRQVTAREDHRPRMSDLRESGAIEQDADRIWLMDRPGIGTAEDNKIELCQAKNRNGPSQQLIEIPYRGGRIIEDHDDPRDDWKGGSYASHTEGRD